MGNYRGITAAGVACLLVGCHAPESVAPGQQSASSFTTVALSPSAGPSLGGDGSGFSGGCSPTPILIAFSKGFTEFGAEGNDQGSQIPCGPVLILPLSPSKDCSAPNYTGNYCTTPISRGKFSDVALLPVSVPNVSIAGFQDQLFNWMPLVGDRAVSAWCKGAQSGVEVDVLILVSPSGAPSQAEIVFANPGAPTQVLPFEVQSLPGPSFSTPGFTLSVDRDQAAPDGSGSLASFDAVIDGGALSLSMTCRLSPGY